VLTSESPVIWTEPAAPPIVMSEVRSVMSEYPGDQDVAYALDQPYRESLSKAIQDFADEINEAPQPLPPDYDVKLRPLAGALKREMNLMQGWLSHLGQIANEQRAALSEIK
jgi:hypothetical protein